MSSTRDKKNKGPAAKAADGPVPPVQQKLPSEKPPTSDPAVLEQSLRGAQQPAGAKQKPDASAAPSQEMGKAMTKHVSPSANGRGHGGGSTSTGASAVPPTGPKDGATSSPVPEVKPKQNKEKSKNQNTRGT